jgi:hypothetical protein
MGRFRKFHDGRHVFDFHIGEFPDLHLFGLDV